MIDKISRLLYPKGPLFFPTFWSYIRQSRFYLFTLLWLRFLVFMLIKRGKVSRLSIKKGHHLEEVVRYQFREDFNMMFFVRGRIEGLLYPLLCIPYVRKIFKTGKILSIGPRNEGELLLLNAHGFSWPNINAVDLFSYSPKIMLMDMHRLDFKDNSFDVLISSWVLRYSYAIQDAVNEIIRVTKNGGVVAIGFSWADNETDNAAHDKDSVGTKLRGGLQELFGYFGEHLDTVYWQVENIKEHQSDISTIFKIKK